MNLDSSLHTNGNAVSITAGTIDIASNVTIDTTHNSGNAGAITLTGPAASLSPLAGQAITLHSNATLNAGTGATAGAVTLSVSDAGYVAPPSPFAATPRAVSISLDSGATIDGGTIAIQASASDLSQPGETVPIAQGLTGELASLLGGIPGYGGTAFPGMDVAAIVRGANASVTIDGATINGTNSVSITSETDVQSDANAVVLPFGTMDAAPAYAQAVGTANTAISGTTQIISTSGDVLIAANGTTTVDTTAQTLTSGTPTFSIAAAISYNNVTAQATVGAGTTIKAASGSVNVLANGVETTTTDASTGTSLTGNSGVSGVAAFDFATVAATVNGAITAGNTLNTSTSFNGASTGKGGAVDVATGTVYLPGNDLTTGEAVTYAIGPGDTPIGGLSAGTTYYVINDGNGYVQLANAPVIALDASGTDPAATQSLSSIATQAFSLDAVDNQGPGNTSEIHIDNDGFNNGDTVVYSSAGSPLGGLTNNGTYVVQALDDSTFQLLNMHGSVVAVSQGTTIGDQTFDDITDGQVQTINLAYVSGNALYLAAHGFINGQSVTYDLLESGGANAINGLSNSASYTVKVISANEIELKDPSGGAVVPITAPGTASLNLLSYIGNTVTFSPGVYNAAAPAAGAVSSHR